MRLTTASVFVLLLLAPAVMAQELEYGFSPDPSADIKDPFAIYVQNGARGVSGPWDLDRDGKEEILVAQHSGSGGLVHVIENAGADVWEHVYSTAFLDSSASSNNARYAIGADLDNDDNWEIVYVSGNGYSGADPDLKMGAYVWEHDGTVGSDNYGVKPASIADFYAIEGLTPGSAHAQTLEASDIDGDGQQELLVAVNGASSHDRFYVLSVTGDYHIDGVGVTFENWTNELVVGPRLDGNRYGGGSPSAAHTADFNGDGKREISFHSWNYLDFFNATASGVDAYTLPDTGSATRFFQSSFPADNVALFGGKAYDIDDDGNEEMFYAVFQTGNIAVLDFDAGDDVLSVDASTVAPDAIPVGGSGGITAGDLDGDGKPELLVGGGGYQPSQYEAGDPSRFIRAAEYNGGDPLLAESYTVYAINTGTPEDTLGFHKVYRDSLGTMSSYFATASSKQGSTKIDAADPVFPSGITYLGDPDGDGDTEVALSFQGVDDSLFVYDEVWTEFTEPDTAYYVRTVREKQLNPHRDFVRIYSFADGYVLKSENRLVLPSDYVLEGSYPNPFTDETRFRITLPLAKHISAKVYDLQGRLVRTLVDDELFEAGPHEVIWDGSTSDGSAAASGVYLMRLQYGNFSQSATTVLVR